MFRLSRILGEVVPDGPAGTVVVPEDADIREIVTSSASPAPDRRTATVRLRRDAAHGIRRWAADVRPDDAGWDVAELGFADVDWLAEYLAGLRRRRRRHRAARRTRRDDPAPEGGPHMSSADRLTRLLALVPYVISRTR